jgi:hypothetical protein
MEAPQRSEKGIEHDEDIIGVPPTESDLDEEFHFTIGKCMAIAVSINHSFLLNALCRCPSRALPERMMLMLLQGMQIGYMAAVFCIQMVSAILTTINADIGR